MNVGLFVRAIAVMGISGAASALSPEGNHVATAAQAGAMDIGAISMRLDAVRLEEALAWWADLAGARVQPMWRGDGNADGLDRDRLLSVVAVGRPRDLLDEILAAADDVGASVTWQTTSRGVVQVGPRTRLNAYRHVQVYDIADLLRETPRFTSAPAIDLDAALSRAGGSVFREGFEENRVRESDEAERASALIGVIMETVEPEQWIERGGSAATIRSHGTVLVVHAPGYVHRALHRPAR